MVQIKHEIDDRAIELFSGSLRAQERSERTIRQYVRDIRAFRDWLGGEASFCRERVLLYKEELRKTYRPSSINAILSALNTFFRVMNWEDCRVSTLKVQRTSFRSSQRNLSAEEFRSLLLAAKEKGQEQLLHIMETLAATGMRISELSCLTVESLSTRRIVVTLKRKTREVLLASSLCKTLRAWCRKKGITSGSIFVTRNGNPVDRSNVLHMMKALADRAGILRSKVFPHNLRHLFAVNYYEQEKDLARLADILGHTNLNTTRLYTMTTCEKEMDALDKVGEAFLLSS